MKFIVLWLGVAAAVLLAVGGVALVIAGVQFIAAQPGLWWIPAIIFGTALIATVVTAIDYLSEKRPPKAPKP